MGRGSTIMWPGGQQVAGVQGMVEAVTKTPYSIGYLELHEAVRAKLGVGAVQNAGDNFAPATVGTVTTTADVTDIGTAPRFTIANAEGRMAHPMCVVKWIAVPGSIKDADKRKATAGFLKWLYGEGQRQLSSMGYATLPAGWLTKMQGEVARIR
jgi:ABC-type phosphate transport system substrate-binding protein